MTGPGRIAAAVLLVVAAPAAAVADEPLPDVHHGEPAVTAPEPFAIPAVDRRDHRWIHAGLRIAPPRPPLAAAQIDQGIRARVPRLRSCLAAVLLRDPGAVGRRRRLVLEVDIDRDGSVHRVDATTAVSPALDRCVVEQVMLARFPASRDGAHVRYPIAFGPR